MSFVEAGNVLARELWPMGIGRTAADQRTKNVLPPWCLVPTSFEDVCEWGGIHSPDRADGDNSRKHVLVYRPQVLVDLENPSMNFQVSVRLQGYLKQLNISTLGNYRGRKDDPAKAVQYMVIEGKDSELPFRAQIDALDNIKALIKAMIVPTSDDESDSRQGRPDEIYLRRRVFTRARGGAIADAVQLTTEDDPHGEAAKIKSNWVVTQRLVTRVQLPDGRLAVQRAFVFKPGDFVEVVVNADIVCLRKYGRTRVDVHFAMKELLRLKSAVELKAMGLTANASRQSESFRDLPPEAVSAHLAPVEVDNGDIVGMPVD